MIVLGLLTRSTKSTRRHALEMISNLLHLRDAYFHFNDVHMNKKLREFSMNLMNQTPNQTSRLVEPHHLIQIHDSDLQDLFTGKISFYSSAYIGKVRLTTSNYCRKKYFDDSSIIYKAGDELHFGRIHRILSVDNGNIVFQVFSLSESIGFRCDDEGDEFIYDGIQTGMISSGTDKHLINADQVVEKCAFIQQHNGKVTFIRFPNLEQSS